MELQVLTSLARTDALRYTTLFSTAAEKGLDRLTRLAARFLDVSVAMVNVIDGEKQICKSIFDGSGELRAGAASPLDSSICHHVMQAKAPLVVEDAREHPLLRTMPPVQTGRVTAYLGVPLVASDGYTLGTFCVIDRAVRRWTDDQVETLSDLAAGVIAEIELRADIMLRQATERELEQTSKRLRIVLDESAIGIALVNLQGQPVEVNPALERMLGYSAEELRFKTFADFTHPDHVSVDWGLFAELIRGERDHYQIEKLYIRKNGDDFWGRLTVSAARDDQRNPLILLGMVEDLTEHRQVQALQTRVRVLEGMLPICMFCKGIRNEDEEWEQLENYISRHTEATFTHGCCPTCIEEHFTEYSF